MAQPTLFAAHQPRPEARSTSVNETRSREEVVRLMSPRVVSECMGIKERWIPRSDVEHNFVWPSEYLFMLTGVLMERLSTHEVNLADCVNDVLLSFERFETSWDCFVKMRDNLSLLIKKDLKTLTKDGMKSVWSRVKQYELDDTAYQYKLSDLQVLRVVEGGGTELVPARRMYGDIDATNPFHVPRMTAAQRSVSHAVGTGQSLEDYYSDVILADEFLIEATATPVEVAEAWDRVWTEMQILDDRTKRFVRAQVIIYAVHNGTSDKLSPRAVWRYNGREFAMSAIIRLLNDPAGTFRRTMRGMAHEARYLLSRNPSIVPAWGRAHGMDMRREDLRLIGYDFADALQDLSNEQRRILERAKARALAIEDRM